MFRGIYQHLIEELGGIYSRFVQNVKTANFYSRSRHDVMQSGRRHEYAQYVTSLKIYFRPRLRAVASRILKSLINQSPALEMAEKLEEKLQAILTKLEKLDAIEKSVKIL